MTDIAPMISKRCRSCCPIFDILPSLVLPPVECCRGASPTQAAKSRPLENISGGAVSTAFDTAVTEPIPGMVINLRAKSF